MNKIRSFVSFLAAAAAASIIMYGCTAQPGPAGASDAKASIQAKVSDEMTGTRIVLAGADYADTVVVSGDSVSFAGLEAGEYTLTVIMPGGQEYRNSVTVNEGVPVYLGEIGIVTCAEATAGNGTVYPGDPAYPYRVPQSDFIAWHTPADGEVITLWQPTDVIIDTVYPQPMPPAVSAPESTGTGTMPAYPEYRPMVGVTVFFSKPMDRASIEQAFSITNAADGYFTWENWFTPVDTAPQATCEYVVMDRTAGAVTSSGGGYMVQSGADTASSPGGVIMPDPGVTPEHVTSMTYYFYPGNDTVHTVTFSTAATDTSGVAVDSGYSFSFSTVTKKYEMPVDPTDPPMPDCFCTMMFASFQVLVLDAAGSPVDSLVTSLSMGGSGVAQPGPGLAMGPGMYTVMDDGYTGFLSTAPDTVVFRGVLGADTVSGTYVFATDSCRCHIQKLSGPDTLVMGN